LVSTPLPKKGVNVMSKCKATLDPDRVKKITVKAKPKKK
jgi:hypothetical protein